MSEAEEVVRVVASQEIYSSHMREINATSHNTMHLLQRAQRLDFGRFGLLSAALVTGRLRRGGGREAQRRRRVTAIGRGCRLPGAAG